MKNVEKLFLVFACIAFLVSVPISAQRSKPKTKPTPNPRPPSRPAWLGPSEKTKTPDDEILFTEQESYERLNHSGWRIAVRSSKDAEDGRVVVYYNKDQTTRAPNGNIRSWLKFENMKNDARQSHSMYLEECDCKQQRFRIPQTTNYDVQGNVINANETITEWGSCSTGYSQRNNS